MTSSHFPRMTTHTFPPRPKDLRSRMHTQLVSRLLDKLRSVLPRFPDATTLTMFPPLLRLFGLGLTFARYIRRCSKMRCEDASLSPWTAEEFVRTPEMLLEHHMGVQRRQLSVLRMAPQALVVYRY